MSVRKKSGPKPADEIGENCRRVNIWIDEETHQILRKSGYGSVSATIRIITKKWAETK